MMNRNTLCAAPGPQGLTCSRLCNHDGEDHANNGTRWPDGRCWAPNAAGTRWCSRKAGHLKEAEDGARVFSKHAADGFAWDPCPAPGREDNP